VPFHIESNELRGVCLTISSYKNSFHNAIPFIKLNHIPNTIKDTAFRIIALIIPMAEPIKYIGIKILVAGSNTVYVRTILAAIRNVICINSHTVAIGL
jgi:hypothetical protein